eukprot:GHRQ01028415.1.p1 GENE.GHRQ01028415.1~~GHRQ01028415.1.p1  ORF type:complete len:106 (+),score=20.62 GHRQ01028415.1:189-506(+)
MGIMYTLLRSPYYLLIAEKGYLHQQVAIALHHGTSTPRSSPHGSFLAYTSRMYTPLPSTPSCGSDWLLIASTNTCRHSTQPRMHDTTDNSIASRSSTIRQQKALA